MLPMKTKDQKLYYVWHASHKCGLNFHGSSPAMEKAGAVSIFEKSVEKQNLNYTSFYSDGDSKAFPSVFRISMKKLIRKFSIICTTLRKLKKIQKDLVGKVV